MSNESHVVIYVDESGDHSLIPIDKGYPVFVLAFSIFTIGSYVSQAVPRFQRLKFHHFGHDQVVLHGRDIRVEAGPFAFGGSKTKYRDFLHDLSAAISETEVTLIACVIDKMELRDRYLEPTNPYELALTFGLERVVEYVRESVPDQTRIHVIAESRGRKEDGQLRTAFELFDANRTSATVDEIVLHFANKRSNSTGLQFSDLVARPIGQYVLNPTSPSRAWAIVESKLRRASDGKYSGYGLKVFP